MLCPKCGTENQEQVDVCINCDEKLIQHHEINNRDTEVPEQVIEPEISKERRETIEWDTDKPRQRITNLDFKSNKAGDVPVVSPGLNIFVLMSSVFLPIIGIAMGFAYLRKPDPDAKKAGKIWVMVGAVFFLIHGLMIMVNAN